MYITIGIILAILTTILITIVHWGDDMEADWVMMEVVFVVLIVFLWPLYILMILKVIFDDWRDRRKEARNASAV
jgi:multisubunit Na+/H+ antiporter MnhG subunit